jgi:enoyl-CoA hydratase
LGVIPGGGGTQRLSRLIGPGKAKEMIFSGKKIDAQEAYRIGLVEKVVPLGEVLNEAKQLAQQILNNSYSAIKNAKMAIDNGLDVGLPEGLRIERSALGLTCASGEQLEGAQAFLEKRKPKF